MKSDSLVVSLHVWRKGVKKWQRISSTTMLAHSNVKAIRTSLTFPSSEEVVILKSVGLGVRSPSNQGTREKGRDWVSPLRTYPDRPPEET